MRDAIDRALTYTESGRDEFFATMMVQDAVVRFTITSASISISSGT
ncbi:MAG TPA: hypothetical protein VFS35_06795 [Terrimicrobiaceae bacterium]|nr:hypothetical protein [Terrimicrobiaceae bacterium]